MKLHADRVYRISKIVRIASLSMSDRSLLQCLNKICSIQGAPLI